MTLQKKIALSFAAIIFVSSALSSAIVTNLYSEQVAEEFEQRLEQGNVSVEQYFIQRSRRAFNTANILAQEKREITDVLLDNIEPREMSIEMQQWRRSRAMDLDYLEIGDDRGEVVVQTSEYDSYGVDDPLIAAALDPDRQTEVSGLEVMEDRGIVVSGVAPVIDGFNQLHGYFKVSTELDADEVEEVKEVTGLDLEIEVFGEPAFSTFPDPEEDEEITAEYLEYYHRSPLKLVGYNEQPLEGVEAEVGLLAAEFMETERRIVILVSMITLLMILAALMGILIFTRRFIISPLEDITQGASLIGQGELDHRIKVREDSKDEISVLARAFNRMAEDLKNYQTAVERAKSVLEIRIEARTRELRELSENLDKQVKERTGELQERVDELEKFHKLTVDRELKMVELKKEIKRLKEELAEAKKRSDEKEVGGKEEKEEEKEEEEEESKEESEKTEEEQTDEDKGQEKNENEEQDSNEEKSENSEQQESAETTEEKEQVNEDVEAEEEKEQADSEQQDTEEKE